MKLLSIKSVIEKTSLSRAQLKRMVKAGTFPAPLKITPRRTGWIEDLIDQWIMSIGTQPCAANVEGVRHEFV